MPVPSVLYTHESEEPLGVPFYVMDDVDGSVVTRAVPAALDTPQERGHIAESLIATLADVQLPFPAELEAAVGPLRLTSLSDGVRETVERFRALALSR